MTGADWRNYEDEFYDWNTAFNRDYGYIYTMNFLHGFIDDYWVVFDGFRCLFLFSVILLLKKLTPFWLSSISFMMPMSLLSLTIDSPFRFMIALMFVNFAVLFFLNSKYIVAILLCLIAGTFHTAIIIVVPFLFFLKTGIFVKMPNWALILLYIGVVVFTGSLNSISNFQNQIGLLFSDFGLNSYKSYAAEQGVSFLTLGLVLESMVFLFVVFNKSIVASHSPNGVLISNMAILCFFIQRIGIAIPTGHRFGWLFTLFVAAFYANLFHIQCFCDARRVLKLKKNVFVHNLRLCFLVLVLYYGGTMTKTIVNHFVYIPYSNSIPYIIVGHKPYNERSDYNIDAYKQRTGKSYILNSDK